MWSQRGGWWVLAQVMLLAVLVVLLVTGVGAFDLPNGPSSLPRIIGAIVVALALVERALGVRDLGVNLTPFPIRWTRPASWSPASTPRRVIRSTER